MKRTNKFLLVVQIVGGLIAIAIVLFTLPNVHYFKDEPADFTVVVDALHGASPTPQQILRAAAILATQKQSLETSANTIEDLFKAILYLGLILVIFGSIMLFDYVRSDKAKSFSAEKDMSAIK